MRAILILPGGTEIETDVETLPEIDTLIDVPDYMTYSVVRVEPGNPKKIFLDDKVE